MRVDLLVEGLLLLVVCLVPGIPTRNEISGIPVKHYAKIDFKAFMILPSLLEFYTLL